LVELAKRRIDMPEMRTLKRARRALREGKAPMTVAGEFVREEIEHIRHGKRGARSPKQIIAMGLAKARRAGLALRAAPKRATAKTRLTIEREMKRAKKPRRASPRRSRASLVALKSAGRKATSSRARAARSASTKRRSRARSMR
jgi:hypothetical protein